VKRTDDLLLPLIKNLGIENCIKLAEIHKNWYNLFKDPLSLHMSPCKLSEGEILLTVDSPVWLQELTYFKGDIIKKLSPYGVKDVRFRLGRVSKKTGIRGKGQGSEVRPLTTEECSYIEETVSQINDKKLKETVKKAMKKALITKQVKR
jgi:hypothetical protein